MILGLALATLVVATSAPLMLVDARITSLRLVDADSGEPFALPALVGFVLLSTIFSSPSVLNPALPCLHV